MTGNTGQLFREFAITLAAAIFFSGVVARTLTPMLCSKLMAPAHGRIQRYTEPLFEGMNNGYRWLLSRALRIPLVNLAIGAVISLLAYNLFVMIPKEFAPTEDRGVIIIPIQAPEGASLDYTRDRVREVEKALKPLLDQGVISSLLSQVAPGFARPSPVNAGLVIVRLVPWDQRVVKQQQVTQQLLSRVSSFPGARAFPVNPPSLGQGGFGNQPIQFVARRPRLRHAARLARPCHAEGAGDRASSSTSIRTTANRSPTSASRSTASAPPISASPSRISAARSN